MKFHQLATELHQTPQKDLARALDVVPRTIRNWGKQINSNSLPRLGRPAHDERAHRAAFWKVGREYCRQGGVGWRAISQGLAGAVPVRLIQKYTRVFKECKRRHNRQRIMRGRERIEVLARDAIWVQDGVQVGRNENGVAIESQVIKDRGPLITVGIATGAPAKGSNVIDLLDCLKTTRGLPLVLGTDNGSPYKSRETDAYLRQEKVIHLRSLPRTPQHNGSAEVGIGELRRCSGLRAALITNAAAAHTRVVKAALLINRNRIRQSKGLKTGAELDETMVVGYHQIERARFYEECSRRIEEAQQGQLSWRARRMAERDAIYETMERYRLVRRQRGGSQAATKREIFL